MKLPSTVKKPAASAVASVLADQKGDDDAISTASVSGRRPRGRTRVDTQSGIDEEVVAKLVAQATGQKSVLLNRICSRDPSTKARTREARITRVNNEPEATDLGSLVLETTKAQDLRRRRRDGQVSLPITVDEFDRKYAKSDQMLHYVLEVIRYGKSVTRAEIPRQPDRLVNAVQRLVVPEEDVLYLVYHRNPPCGFRNVYWLEFITEDYAIDVALEYFAISHHGLTHYRGSSVIDFVDVDNWVMEKRAFDHMTAMRGLQKLQELLFFMSWKKKAIRMKHRRVRDRIACSSFQCDPTAARLLVAVRECCVKIELIAVSHHLASGTTYTADYIRQHFLARLGFLRTETLNQADAICQLVEREILLLQRQRQVDEEAGKQNYANISRSSRLLDRLYVFLRLLDLQLFESLSIHMSDFIMDLHTQICGAKSSQDIAMREHLPQNSANTSYADTKGDSTITIPPDQGCLSGSVVPYRTHFSLPNRTTPSPFVFAEVVDNVSFYQNVPGTQVCISPAQSELFEVIYGLLDGYVTALDGIPRLLSNPRFGNVLAPYTPQNREKFIATLLKPSTQILQERAKDMKQMKFAIETYFKQLEIHTSDLLRLVGDIYTASANEAETKASNELSPDCSSSLLTAAQYEEIRGVWRELLVETQQLPRFMQIGVILLDQSSLLNRLEEHVTKHINALIEELPGLYKHFLCELLADADGRIESIMNIPTSVPDAIQWLKEMVEMMPTQDIRKAFDARCSNLLRLKQLLKDSGATFQSAEEKEFVKKKDYEWESLYETLITCFVRVQDKDSEHRRSVVDLNGKADEHTATQLERIKHDFSQLPSHVDEQNLNKHRTKELVRKKKAIVDCLEQLVTVDGEREEMLELYDRFEAEHRLLTEQSTLESSESSRLPQKWIRKSPGELLLQHISAVFDMRTWFRAWIALEEKWLDTPLVNTHPSMVLNRLKQFRRRLQFSVARLLPRASALGGGDDFVLRDYALVQDLEIRVDQMTSDYVMFQAATCGAFSPERWQLCRSMLGMEMYDHQSITLRMVKARADDMPERVAQFKGLCEVVVIESKLLNIAKQLRQRANGCQVLIRISSSGVQIENIQEAVLELDDIEVEVKLLSQAMNPYLEDVLRLQDDVRAMGALCNRLLSFQGLWEELCRLSRVHDIDELFTGQAAWKGHVQRQKKKVGREESAWGDFIDVAQNWAERLRRLACIRQSSIPVVQAITKPRADPVSQFRLACTLEDVQEAFRDFDFDLSVTKCENARLLVDKYLSVACEQCPRLYCLNKEDIVQLLVHDEDITAIRNALSICFPNVTSFNITGGRKENLQEIGTRLSRGTASESSNSFTITGITSGTIVREFSVPVVKVGRLRFWLTRLEEEMRSLVTENAKEAVATSWMWAGGANDVFGVHYYQNQLPQSVQLALSLRFTSTVVSTLWPPCDTHDIKRPFDGNILSSSTRLSDLCNRLLCDAINFASNCGALRNDVRLESIILQLQHQAEVIQRMDISIQAGRIGDAELMWDAHFKIDFIVEDMGAKTSRRVRVCDGQRWTDWAMLGPTFPVTFLATIGQSEFCLGYEMIGIYRTPIVTPLTHRCYFEVMRAVRGHPLQLISPINSNGRGGHHTIIQGIAQMLMISFREILCSRMASIENAVLVNVLRCVACMGGFLSMLHIEELETSKIRVVVEKVNQLRQDQLHRSFLTSEQRPFTTPALIGCIFVPVDGMIAGEDITTRDMTFGSLTDAFQPVAILLPSVAQFTRTAALLAGYKLEEISKLQSVVTFFELLAIMDPCLAPTSSNMHRLIICVMRDVSLFRSNCRVLLPYTGKWPSSVPETTHSVQISRLFRRSADGHDVSDVVVETLFYHALTIRRGEFIGVSTGSGIDLSHQMVDLIDRCFPCAQGCEVIDKATKTREQALRDAVGMSLAQSGILPSVTILEKTLELFEHLQTSLVVVVIGQSEVGKSLCIRTLHNAIQAVEIAEMTSDSSNSFVGTTSSQLHVISSRFLFSDNQVSDYRTKSLLKHVLKIDALSPRRWLCIDGIVDPARVEPFVRHYMNTMRESDLKPSFSAYQTRILLETTSLEYASPAFLTQTRIHHIPHLLGAMDLVANWRESWMAKLLLPEDSRAFENVQLVLRMTDVLIKGPVREFAVGEEAANKMMKPAGNTENHCIFPTHLGMLSVNQLIQCCLQLVGSTCFTHRSQLEERSPAQMIRLVGFCVIWGFTGHLAEQYRQKLDLLVCAVLKQRGEMRYAGDTLEGLYESERLGNDFWDTIQLPLRGSRPREADSKGHTRSSISRVIDCDKFANRILVLPNASLSLFRVLRLLVRSTISFMIVGPRGSGKSSLLRLLWAMNAEDQATESLVEASLDHRFCSDILNWQDKPRNWFDRPTTSPATPSQYYPRATDEVKLFATYSAGAAKFVFVDDVAMPKPSGVVDLHAVDEFVRVAVDHKVGINWTYDRIMPLSKQFAVSMTTQLGATPKVRAPHHTERLLHHFCVFRMPVPDRQNLQGLFRQVYIECFTTSAVSNFGTASPSRVISRNESVLSLPEVVLRASVDMAVEILTLQQTTERLELIDGFTFNLHHLNELLSRSLSFIRVLVGSKESSTDTNGGATLLSLGKLHQCWVSSVRQVFLASCSYHAPEPEATELSGVLASDEITKVNQTLKIVGEKYFSVPARDDPHAVTVTDIVYGVYRYLHNHSATSTTSRIKLGELLTSNASGSSSTGARRNGIVEGGSIKGSSGSVMARDEFSVQVAHELMYEHATDMLSDMTASSGPISIASRLGLRLHLGSSAGLHHLLKVVHGIRFSPGILIDHAIDSILQSTVRLAFAIEEYEVVELNVGKTVSDAFIQEKLEEALGLAGTERKRVALWIDLDIDCGQRVTDLLVAVATGKLVPVLFESQKLRSEAVECCVRDQRHLQLLSLEDANAHFHQILREHLRLCVVAQHGTPQWLVELMRASSTFQWTSFNKRDMDDLRYRGEVVEQAIHELTNHLKSTMSRELTTATTDGESSWSSLYSLCASHFEPTTHRWSQHLFITFLGNVVADCKRRTEEIKKQVEQRAGLLQVLCDIRDRVPLLHTQSERMRARMHQLSLWYYELHSPLLDFRMQLRERIVLMHDQEAELTSDDFRALQRKVQKLENQVWAHKCMMEEYDLARTEVGSRHREIEAELSHWTKYDKSRETIETRTRAQLEELQSVRARPQELLPSSVNAYRHMLEPMSQSESSDVGHADENPHKVDSTISLLWQARFGFLRHDNRAEQVLHVLDTVYDKIPLVVDNSSLFQHILVHIFSNVPWFSDGNEENDRREAIGFTASGAVAPMIIQCDEEPKMWRKLQEAVEKEVPTLLVGVTSELIAPLSRFAQQHAQQPRKNYLKDLTMEAYRAQLKRDLHQPKPLSLTSNLVGSIMTNQSSDEKGNRRQGVVPTSFKTISASVNAGGARRGSMLESKGGIARRSSVSGGSVASSKGLGFQLYAVTHSAIDHETLNRTGQFIRFSVSWCFRSVEVFFTESAVRRYDKKLYKDLTDARRVEADSSYLVDQAEEALWPIVRSPTCISLSEREEFMMRLDQLVAELERRRLRISKNQSRLALVESRLKGFEVIGRNMAHIAQTVETYTIAVQVGSNRATVRNLRLFEQLLEVILGTLLKHEQAASVQATSGKLISRLSRHVVNELVHSVVEGLPSESHQRIFLAALAITFSSDEYDATAPVTSKSESVYMSAFTWLLHHGCVMWSRTIQSGEKTKSSDTEERKQGPNDSATETTGSPAVTSSISSGSSLVERLRRKVRVCSLIFEQIGKVRNNPLPQQEDNARLRKRTSTAQTNVDSNSQNDVRMDAHKDFREIARVAKSLWCEWKLAREDQHADMRRALVIILNATDSRPTQGGLWRKPRDMVLGSPNVTQVLNLGDVAAQYLVRDETESRTLEERLVVTMLAKAYFPHLLLHEWETCLTMLDPMVQYSETPTSQLLGLDSSEQPEAFQDLDLANDAISSISHISTRCQLPPSIDVAWRRDDLVHLPTWVLLYDQGTDQTTIAVLLLRARDSAQPNPLRLFSILAWGEGESRLEKQLTAAVTNKERLAVEITQADHFNRVIALMSNVINQHALLCIPEWYMITTIQIFERVYCPAMGFLRPHVVKKVAEPINVTLQLTHWLISNAGLADTDAGVAAQVLLHQADCQSDSSIPSKPLIAMVETLVTRLKMITQSGESAARQQQLKQLLLKEMGLDTKEKAVSRSIETRDVAVRRTKSSLQFLSDLFLLPSPTSPVGEILSASMATAKDKCGLPFAIMELCAQLESICEALGQRNADFEMKNNDPVTHVWRSLMTEEHERTISRIRALLGLLRRETVVDANRNRAQDHALIQQGIVPVDWLAHHFSMWSDACLANVISVAQMLVLLVSRLGFVLYDMSHQSPSTLNLSLLDDPRSFLRRLRELVAGQVGCDPVDVVFELQPGVVQMDGYDDTTEEVAFTAGANSYQRRYTQTIPLGLDPANLPTNRAVVDMKFVPTCLVVGEDGTLCGIQIDGLVAVERVDRQMAGGTNEIFIHKLPVCRLVCQPPQAGATQPTSVKNNAGTWQRTENLTIARLSDSGARLTTIVSTSAFQTLPESFWDSPRDLETDPNTLLPHVQFATSLLMSVPSLSRERSEHDGTHTIMLGIPMLPADDDDQDV